MVNTRIQVHTDTLTHRRRVHVRARAHVDGQPRPRRPLSRRRRARRHPRSDTLSPPNTQPYPHSSRPTIREGGGGDA